MALHGDFKSKRDSVNKVGGGGKGYRVDLGACDHNFQGENTSGVGTTPRTNGGVNCFDDPTGDEELDLAREGLRVTLVL